MDLGPIPMEVTDLVIVLRGGKIPFFLRRMNDYYRFIGCADANGIMDNEKVSAWKERKRHMIRKRCSQSYKQYWQKMDVQTERSQKVGRRG